MLLKKQLTTGLKAAAPCKDFILFANVLTPSSLRCFALPRPCFALYIDEFVSKQSKLLVLTLLPQVAEHVLHSPQSPQEESALKKESRVVGECEFAGTAIDSILI